MATALHVRSLTDFLAWERQQPERYERVSGVVRMMTGGTIDHNRIVRNVAEALARAAARTRLRSLHKRCQSVVASG